MKPAQTMLPTKQLTADLRGCTRIGEWLFVAYKNAHEI